MSFSEFVRIFSDAVTCVLHTKIKRCVCTCLDSSRRTFDDLVVFCDKLKSKNSLASVFQAIVIQTTIQMIWIRLLVFDWIISYLAYRPTLVKLVLRPKRSLFSYEVTTVFNVMCHVAKFSWPDVRLCQWTVHYYFLFDLY